jgi:putative tricarboxylic transport membrane protein
MSAPATETAGPRAQAVAFGVLAVLGAAVFGTSFGYGILGEEGRVGPGLLPMVTGLLLLLLSTGQLVTRVLRGGPSRRTARSSVPVRQEGRSSDSDGDDGPGVDVFGRTEPQRVRQLWTVVGALPVAVLLVPLLGFLPALGLLVLFVSAVVERRPPLVAILVTVIAVAAGYGVFAEFLDVPLPTGAVGDALGW